ncbi:hypothetical protein [Oceaniglobus roseus]|uniref:hypothetical protein n=1 Tax=Oceaniglobus roseus TaxID=1737570 RepID=UPI000C7F1C29|nr:hypothetical protein [Kandeliimicrobium roseum]
MRTELRRGGLAAVLLLAPTLAGAQQDPLSAIGWLSDSVVLPAEPAALPRSTPPTEASDIPSNALPEDITVTPLDAPSPDTVGLVPARRLGLPADLWGASSSAALAQKIAHPPAPSVPALRELFKSVLIAQVDPPLDSLGENALFLARIDALLDLGSLRDAARLLDQAGKTEPAYFRRWFDIALLTGTEDTACDRMRALPQISPTYAARIFCLARTGDWHAAALTLETAKALGLVEGAEDNLLGRFLLAGDDQGGLSLPPLRNPTPLQYAMYEAIGEPISTNNLPIAFAHADLRPMIGWKARISAAERLARAGAIGVDRLLEVYSERMPAASGGVWDRVEAVQRLLTALDRPDPTAVSAALPGLWSAAREAGLEVPFAEAFGQKLATLPLDDAADTIRLKLGLLSPDYAAIARAHGPRTEEQAFWIALATADMAETPAPDPMDTALRDGFLADAPQPDIAALIEQDRKGEALLAALDGFADGARGNLDRLAGAVAALRALGLDGTARRAALQLAILRDGT